MDNDGALLEVLRNTYKGLRFRWKYRGLIILPAEQGNAAGAGAIRARPPGAVAAGCPIPSAPGSHFCSAAAVQPRCAPWPNI